MITYKKSPHPMTSKITDYILSNGVQFRKIQTTKTTRKDYKFKYRIYDKETDKTVVIDENTMFIIFKIFMAENPLGGALYGEVK